MLKVVGKTMKGDAKVATSPDSRTVEEISSAIQNILFPTSPSSTSAISPVFKFLWTVVRQTLQLPLTIHYSSTSFPNSLQSTDFKTATSILVDFALLNLSSPYFKVGSTTKNKSTLIDMSVKAVDVWQSLLMVIKL